jgi:hypothetical protein
VVFFLKMTHFALSQKAPFPQIRQAKGDTVANDAGLFRWHQCRKEALNPPCRNNSRFGHYHHLH